MEEYKSEFSFFNERNVEVLNKRKAFLTSVLKMIIISIVLEKNAILNSFIFTYKVSID